MGGSGRPPTPPPDARNRPGKAVLMAHDAAIRGIGLMTREVIPAIKAYQPDREKGKDVSPAGRFR